MTIACTRDASVICNGGVPPESSDYFQRLSLYLLAIRQKENGAGPRMNYQMHSVLSKCDYDNYHPRVAKVALRGSKSLSATAICMDHEEGGLVDQREGNFRGSHVKFSIVKKMALN